MKDKNNGIRRTGIPSKGYIRLLVVYYLKSINVDVSQIHFKAIVFSEQYLDPDKSTGILWKATKRMEPLIGLDQYLEEHGIKVKRAKYYGDIHSIWLCCESAPE
jgi:hypothetical protein